MSEKEMFTGLSKDCVDLEVQATAGTYEGFGHMYPDQNWQHFIDATTPLVPIINGSSQIFNETQITSSGEEEQASVQKQTVAPYEFKREVIWELVE